MRWLWFEKTRPDRPWAGLEIPAHANNLAMFAMVTSVGNGANTLFLSDHWLHGCSLEELAPEIHKRHPPEGKKIKNGGPSPSGQCLGVGHKGSTQLSWANRISTALGCSIRRCFEPK